MFYDQFTLYHMFARGFILIDILFTLDTLID